MKSPFKTPTWILPGMAMWRFAPVHDRREILFTNTARDTVWSYTVGNPPLSTVLWEKAYLVELSSNQDARIPALWINSGNAGAKLFVHALALDNKKKRRVVGTTIYGVSPRVIDWQASDERRHCIVQMDPEENVAFKMHTRDAAGYHDIPSRPAPMTTDGTSLGDFLTTSMTPTPASVLGARAEGSTLVVRSGVVQRDGRVMPSKKFALKWVPEPLRMVDTYYGTTFAAVGTSTIALYTDIDPSTTMSPVKTKTYTLPGVGGISKFSSLDGFRGEQPFLVASPEEGVIRKATMTELSVLAGSVGEFGLVDGPLSSSRFVGPVAIAASHEALVAYVLDARKTTDSDVYEAVLREIDFSGKTVRTVFGSFDDPKSTIKIHDPRRGQVRMVVCARRVFILDRNPQGSVIHALDLDHETRDTSFASAFAAKNINDFTIVNDFVYVTTGGGAEGPAKGLVAGSAQTVQTPLRRRPHGFDFRDGLVTLSYDDQELYVYCPRQDGTYPAKPGRFGLAHRSVVIVDAALGRFAYRDEEGVIRLFTIDLDSLRGEPDTEEVSMGERSDVKTLDFEEPTGDSTTILSVHKGNIYAYSRVTRVLRVIEEPFSSSPIVHQVPNVNVEGPNVEVQMAYSDWSGTGAGDVFLSRGNGVVFLERMPTS
ncbi:hypothetical protein [Polyangium sp. y55x31]|uniref:hypothetical protein n=1 Tax=Polyangium sp. y55x31 TaxID=3042688 RepID=UPI0024822C8C|nr:hypothetical protein [Polyangium sp. y55x31]MDI1482858.1 hypothetical protein [Polyangium sp. y55x31]